MIGLLRRAITRALAFDGVLARLKGASVLEQVLEAGGAELRHVHDQLARAEQRVLELEALLDGQPAATECTGEWCARRSAKGTPMAGTDLCLWCTNRWEAPRG